MNKTNYFQMEGYSLWAKHEVASQVQRRYRQKRKLPSNCLLLESFKYLNANFAHQHLSAFTDRLAFASLERSSGCFNTRDVLQLGTVSEKCIQGDRRVHRQKYLPNLR